MLQDVDELAGTRIPDPRGAVAAPACKQPPVGAERERADPAFGQSGDDAAGAGAVQRRGRSLSEAVGDGEDLARRVQDGREDAAAETDRPRLAALEVDEADVCPAPDEKHSPVERKRDDGRSRRDRPDRRRASDAPQRHSAVLGSGGEEAAVEAPGGRGQAMLPRQTPELVARAVVKAESSVVARDEEVLALRRERCRDDVPAEAQDAGLAHRAETRAKDVCSVLAGRELRATQRELDADLRIDRDLCKGAGRELPAVRVPRLRPRIAPLNERVRRDRGDDGERDERRADDRLQPAPLAPRSDADPPQLVLRLPGEDRRAEDVVEDLVACRRAVRAVDATDDSLPRKRVE